MKSSEGKFNIGSNCVEYKVGNCVTSHPHDKRFHLTVKVNNVEYKGILTPPTLEKIKIIAKLVIKKTHPSKSKSLEAK